MRLVVSSRHGLMMLASAQLEMIDHITVRWWGIIEEPLLVGTDLVGAQPNCRHGWLRQNWAGKRLVIILQDPIYRGRQREAFPMESGHRLTDCGSIRKLSLQSTFHQSKFKSLIFWLPCWHALIIFQISNYLVAKASMCAVINFRYVNVSLKFPIVTYLQYTGLSEV